MAPLLHRQIARQMRLHPKRGGGMPIELITHPLGILVSAVAGEMASPPLEASVGALLYVTRSEMIARGRPVDEGIHTLNNDARAQFVYVDPVKARQAADALRDTADHAKGTPVEAQFRALADRFYKDADVCEARMKTRPASESKKQIAFYASFYDFMNRWEEFYYTIKFKPDDNFDTRWVGNELPNKIDNFRSEYLFQYDSFQKANGVPSKAPPPPSDAGDVHVPDVVTPVVNAVTSIAKPLMWGGLVIGGAILFASVYRPNATASR